MAATPKLPENIRRGVETLAAIARIPSLQGGVVVFDGPDLTGGRWYEAEHASPGAYEPWVPVPVLSDEATLLEDCGVKLLFALDGARDTLWELMRTSDDEGKWERAEQYRRRLAAFEIA